jgi:PiT family inorganic phosphate transporter
MNDPLTITLVVIAAAVLFDFINGFHDAANSIATIVATRVLKPWQAVLWAAFFNFFALFIFSSGVAKTVGSGMIGLVSVTPYVIFAGLCGAILWGILTWWLRLPTSSSHALLGGYAGAAIGHNYLEGGWATAFDPIIIDGWIPTLAFIIIAPGLGALLAMLFSWFISFLTEYFAIFKNTKWLGRAQMASSAFLSLLHGANDAQKTAGIIGGVLMTAGFEKSFTIPYWALCLSYFTMALGTLFGGWRIVNTVGQRITKLEIAGGFAAETAGALSILLATLYRLPVSTTHVATGSVLGVGMSHGSNAVHWNIAARIVWAWLLTIPAAGLLGLALIYGIETFKK